MYVVVQAPKPAEKSELGNRSIESACTLEDAKLSAATNPTAVSVKFLLTSIIDNIQMFYMVSE